MNSQDQDPTGDRQPQWFQDVYFFLVPGTNVMARVSATYMNSATSGSEDAKSKYQMMQDEMMRRMNQFKPVTP